MSGRGLVLPLLFLLLIDAPLPGQCRVAHLFDSTDTSGNFGEESAIDGDVAVFLDSVDLRIYRRLGGDWAEEAVLTDVATPQHGESIALSGSTLVLGQPGTGLEKAVVFDESAGTWSETITLTGSGLAARFGEAVAIDDDLIVVGARREDLGADEAGAVYVFRRTAGAWQEEAVLTPDIPVPGGEFGSDVEVDGDTILVCAWLEQAVYAFEHQGNGVWNQQQRMEVGPGALIGHAVALDGDFAVLSGVGFSSEPDSFVYVYQRAGGFWQLEQALLPSVPQPGSGFGVTVALSGTRALIGATAYETTTSEGVVFHYERVDGEWAEMSAISITHDSSPHFARSLALDGDTAVIGAPEEAALGCCDGAGYLYDFGGACLPAPFIRGDLSQNGSPGVDDAILLLGVLFLPSLPLNCQDRADVNDDGVLGIVDPIALLDFLFVAGAPPPPAPQDGCGLDPTPDDLDPCFGHDACP